MSQKSDQIIIYTDGGCDKNPGGTGGWAFRIISSDKVLERSGRVESTTNNRMEMLAAINALEALKKPAKVELFSDSQYLVKGISEWIHNWVRRGWKLKDGSPVKNDDLWKKLYELNKKHSVTWTWVRGHADDQNNILVDKLVRAAIKGKIAKGKSKQVEAISAVPQVRLSRGKGKPAAVTINLKSASGAQVDRPVSLKIGAEHLQKLIEDLIAAQRKIEEP